MFVSSRSSLCRWWLKECGCEEKFLRLLMLKTMPMRIYRDGSCLWRSSAVVKAINYALLMICLSGCDFISMCVVV